MRKSKNQLTSEYWAWVAKRGEKGFWDLPGWFAHQNILASGSLDQSWLDVVSKEVKEKGVALSLGCGNGNQEIQLYKRGLATRIEGCDISPDLITSAQAEAEKKNLPFTYFVTDLNRPNFKKNHYSLIYAAGILHHIEHLEELFEAVYQALTPNGVFLVYDYVGPTRFQWTKEQTAECHALLKTFPIHYRWKRGYPWYYTAARMLFNVIPFLKTKCVEAFIRKNLPDHILSQYLRLKQARLLMNEVIPPPVEQFQVTDPSEAIRSSEIMPLLDKYFVKKRCLPQGGTLVQPLFNRTVSNFFSEKGIKFAERVFTKERELILSNELPSDFVALVLCK